MKHSIDELLGVAYHYYPRGIPSADPRYRETEEYRRLSAARRQAGAGHEPWRAMLRRLHDHFPENDVANRSLHLPTGLHDAAYSGEIYLPVRKGEHRHTLGFFVSFVVPYYLVYASRTIDDLAAMAARGASPPSPRPETVDVHIGDTCFELPARVLTPEFRAKARAQAEAEAAADASRPCLRRDFGFGFSPDEQPHAARIAQEIEATFGGEPMPPEVGDVIVPDVATNLRDLGEARLYDCLLSDDW
jgi:hypothetical protein